MNYSSPSSPLFLYLMLMPESSSEMLRENRKLPAASVPEVLLACLMNWCKNSPNIAVMYLQIFFFLKNLSNAVPII